MQKISLHAVGILG